jgi:hypothetical protein
MKKEGGTGGTYRSDGAKTIADEPEMQELTRLYDDMTDQEKKRTLDYLQESEEARPDGKSQ